MTVPSPCINVCRMHPQLGLCEGCARTIDEIVAWGRADDGCKTRVWAALPARRQQLADMGVTVLSRSPDA
jgi:uncharacterized protein